MLSRLYFFSLISSLNKSTLFLILLMFVCSFTSSAATLSDVTTLTVSQAYESVPHRRTTYSASKSSQPAHISHYIALLFDATDLALVERVKGLNGVFSKDRYQRRVENLNSITPPESLETAHRLIVNAVTEHKEYFNGEQQDRNLIRSSHHKLIQAYKILLKESPDTAHNQQAYFDHLCALDFI